MIIVPARLTGRGSGARPYRAASKSGRGSMWGAAETASGSARWSAGPARRWRRQRRVPPRTRRLAGCPLGRQAARRHRRTGGPAPPPAARSRQSLPARRRGGPFCARACRVAGCQCREAFFLQLLQQAFGALVLRVDHDYVAEQTRFPRQIDDGGQPEPAFSLCWSSSTTCSNSAGGCLSSARAAAIPASEDSQPDHSVPASSVIPQ